jgi:hypothetical protein
VLLFLKLSLALLALPSLAWAGEAFVTDSAPKPEPALDKPALCAPGAEPTFGTTLERVTDSGAMGFSGVANEYPKAQPWSADGSFFLVRTTNGHYFLIGRDCEVVRELPFAGDAEPRWSPTDPNLLRFLAGNQIKEFRVDTGEVRVLHVFPEYDRVATNGEGNWSADFDYIALIGSSGGAKEVFVYRASDDEVFEKLALAASIDWVSITPESRQVLVMFSLNDTWESDGAAGRRPGFGLELFDLHMKNRRRVQDHVHHGDVCLAAGGGEAFVGSASNAPGADLHRIRMTRLDDALPMTEAQAADFTATSLLTLDWFINVHVSCRNLAAPGWAYVSTYGGPSPSEVPFADELFAVSLDGSQSVRRLAHMRVAYGTYFEEPHAVVAPDGSAVLFTSNWGQSPGAEAVDVYRVTLPVPPGGGGGGGFGDFGVGDESSGESGRCGVAPSGGRAGAALVGMALLALFARRRPRRR